MHRHTNRWRQRCCCFHDHCNTSSNSQENEGERERPARKVSLLSSKKKDFFIKTPPMMKTVISVLFILFQALPRSRSECPFATGDQDEMPNDRHHLRVLRASAETGQKTFDGCDCVRNELFLISLSTWLTYVLTHNITKQESECGASITDEYVVQRKK